MLVTIISKLPISIIISKPGSGSEARSANISASKFGDGTLKVGAGGINDHYRGV